MTGLRDGPIREKGLKVRQVYDETDYINSSIALVMQNIYFGGVLAIVILLVFLRSWRPTVVIAFAIPVSVIGSFVAMALLGRSLNVISLAGIAFAVGMVVDAAIVVLENIYRLRQTGMSPHRSRLSRYRAGVAGGAGFRAHHGDGVHPDPDHGSRGRPALPRHRSGDFRFGAVVAGGFRHADSRALEPLVGRTGTGPGTRCPGYLWSTVSRAVSAISGVISRGWSYDRRFSPSLLSARSPRLPASSPSPTCPSSTICRSATGTSSSASCCRRLATISIRPKRSRAAWRQRRASTGPTMRSPPPATPTRPEPTKRRR